MKNSEDLRDRYKDFILFKRVLIHLKPYSGLVSLAVLLLLAVSILNLTGPYLTKIVIDDNIKEGNINGLDVIAAIYFAVLIFSFIFQFFQTYFMQYIGQKVMFDLRSQVFSHLHKMSFSYFDKNSFFLYLKDLCLVILLCYR